MEQDSTPASTDSTKPVVLLACAAFAVILFVTLPFPIVAAVFCGVPLALWWLSSAQQSTPTGATADVSATKVRIKSHHVSKIPDEHLWVT